MTTGTHPVPDPANLSDRGSGGIVGGARRCAGAPRR